MGDRGSEPRTILQVTMSRRRDKEEPNRAQSAGPAGVGARVAHDKEEVNRAQSAGPAGVGARVAHDKEKANRAQSAGPAGVGVRGHTTRKRQNGSDQGHGEAGGGTAVGPLAKQSAACGAISRRYRRTRC